MQPVHITFRAGVVILGVAVASVSASAEPLVVEPADLRTNWFAGREASFGTVIRGGEAVAGRLAWVLAVANRTLASGAVDVHHPGVGATRADVGVAIPEGREGVVVDAELATALVDAGGTRLGACVRRVRIFPADPFAGRARWLESLRLAIVDPPGDTERVLQAAGVPFTSVTAEADVSALRPGLLVVGEGASWIDHPRLPRDIALVAAAGANVLCLAPRDGTMPLPGNADEPGALVARSLLLRRADVVADVDARLDWRDWVASGDAVACRLAVEPEGGSVIARAGAGPAGWPWLEARFAVRDAEEPSGKLVVCGFGIVAHWDETPAARYLLAALLERLTAKQPVDGVGQPRIEPPRTEPPKEDER